MATLHDLVQENSIEHKSVDSSLSSPSPAVNSRPQSLEQWEQLTGFSRELSEPTSSRSTSLVHQSLSSASSFQSLASNLSFKSSIGICADFVPSSPDKINCAFDHSYVNIEIPEVDDLIHACANINLNESVPESLDDNINNFSQDQTFSSATDDTIANETQIELRLEESIQTFETCPVLEKNQVLKEALLSTSIFQTPILVKQLSIIPYVSFEHSVLKRYQNELEQLSSVKFKGSLNSLQVDEISLTPSAEIELFKDETNIFTRNEAIIKINETADFALRNTYEQKKQDAPEAVLCIDNVQEVQAFNSAIVLSLESKIDDSNKSILKTAEKLNLSALREESTQINESEQVKTTYKNDIVKKSKDFVHDSESKIEFIGLNKTDIIAQKVNNLNKSQDCIKEEIFLNNCKDIVQKDSSLNKTQDVTEKINKNEKEIPKCNNKIFTENTQNLKSFFKEVLLSTTKKQKIEDKESDVSIQESTSSKESDTCVENDIKTFNKPGLLNQKKAKTTNSSEAFIFEDLCKTNILNTKVIASTPLILKNFIKEDIQENSNRKGALFANKSETDQEIIESLNSLIKKEVIEENEGIINFDETVSINKSFEKLFSSEFIPDDNHQVSNNLLHDNSLKSLPLQESEYESFKPQQQSTNLPYPDPFNFRVLQEAALSVAKDIDDSLENIEDSEHFVSATTELFGDPAGLDFLNQIESQTVRRGERYDSLYMKFDPLAQRQSMLPQKNHPTSLLLNEGAEKEVKVETFINNMGTPKKNPALAAIDRLLFYSPCSVLSTDTEVAGAKQKREITEKQEPQLVSIVDENMMKELELVRSTVLQLEVELEKQKQEHKEHLDRQKETFKEKIIHIETKCNQMQSQLTQEVKCKDQMTVVVEEYEKSISRLIAEREKDRTSFESEKVKLQEELQVANQHLSNTEAAFSDVHSKYERLKNVVSAYKSNETVLKESIAENQETIKTLENRYEQLKSHAMAQLEKANLELNAIRKHNEAETIKLKALVRKAELKSKSLEETVEQKMKENKELTQIIDEMIARVD